ncbi:MAG: DNA mismatch repair endonuclease MutL [Clostridia bacterium]|nr:DNA mismatch repair endonuclease MutL [Clostridia bacterium]
MPRINVLPKNIADLIAAGEVVERPSSVIKEFVENSIDAGAANITVEIKNGGKTYIRVTDNGCGIDREDVKKAFISHATSKITNIEDLDAISTLGFRGEALASVCAVSRVELLTATPDSDFGTRYVIEGGEEILLDDAGCPVGTTIIVRDLFYNIPARMKFLKKDVQEGNYIATLMERIAVSNPNISFKFIRDGKLQFSTPGDKDLKSAIYAVFGKDFTDSLIPVHNEQNGISVKGFVAKPTAGRSSRSMQIFFVNKRFVKSVVFLSALEAAYKNSIMVGKYPACVLFVDMPYESVDVNVHPAKTEVRFFEEKKVFDCVYYGTLSALQGDTTRVQAKFSEAKIFSKPADVGEQLKITEIEKHKVINEQPKVIEIKEYGKAITGVETVVHSPEKEEPKQLDFLKDEYIKPTVSKIVIGNENNEKNEPVVENNKPQFELKINIESTPVIKAETVIEEKITEPEKVVNVQVTESVELEEKAISLSYKYIGEAFNTYLIAELDGKLVMIDKHAAHERILFEKFKKDGCGQSQIMLQPVTVTLSPDEYNAVLENIELLADAGYDVSDFGDRCVKVSACPPELVDCNISDIVTEISGYLANNVKTLMPEKLDWIYHSMACRAAVKAGNFTSSYEAEKFVEGLLKRDDIRYCPHGRPVMIEMTKKELEKQFKRIV